MRLYFIIIVVVMFMLSTLAYADSNSLNLNIPSSSQSYQSDKIRAGDIDCQNAIGSATNVEFGVVGIINQGGDPYGQNNISTANNDSYGSMVKDVGVYAKITIPIGGPKERINCNTLYQLELEKKRLEVQKLKAEIQNLRELKFEN